MRIASTAEALLRLPELVTGLSFISESDAPVRVARLAESSPGAALLASGKPAASPLSEISIDQFLARAVVDQPFHGAAERAVVERYRTLREFLSHELRGTRVFRVGSIEVDIYAVGQTRDGDWLGVATQVIET
jgi:hypothetical protein